jgi:hypothetical protein
MMKNILYKKMRVVLIVLTTIFVSTSLQAQESLHLFYKYGAHEIYKLTPDVEIKFVKIPYLEMIGYELTDSVLSISSSAGRTFGFGTVISSDEWNASVDVAWLRVRQNKLEKMRQLAHDGTVQDVFLLFAEPNTTAAKRQGTVTINMLDKVLRFEVEQLPGILSLDPLGDTWGMEPTLSKEEVIANSDTIFFAYAFPNVGVKLKSYPEWMTLKYVRNNGDAFTLDMVDKLSDDVPLTYENLCETFSEACFTFSPNTSSEDRTGDIVFELGGQNAVYHVVQKGLDDNSNPDN